MSSRGNSPSIAAWGVRKTLSADEEEPAAHLPLTERLKLLDKEAGIALMLKEIPAFGMWEHREDMKDPQEWLGRTRRKRGK